MHRDCNRYLKLQLPYQHTIIGNSLIVEYLSQCHRSGCQYQFPSSRSMLQRCIRMETRDLSWNIMYVACFLWQSVHDVEKFLSCCSPSINNPRPHIVLLTSLAIVFKTDSEISFLVSGKQYC